VAQRKECLRHGYAHRLEGTRELLATFSCLFAKEYALCSLCYTLWTLWLNHLPWQRLQIMVVVYGK